MAYATIHAKAYFESAAVQGFAIDFADPAAGDVLAPAAGDMLVVVDNIDEASSYPGAISEWTQIGFNALTPTGIIVYAKISDGTETGLTIPYAGVARVHQVEVLQFKGHGGIAALIAATATASGGNNYTSPSVETLVNECLVIAISAAASNTGTSSNIPSGTALIDWHLSGTSTLALASFQQAAFGPTGTKTWTNTSQAKRTATIAIPPVGAGSAGITSVTGPNGEVSQIREGETAVIVGTNFEATGAAATYAGDAATVTAQSNTEISATMPVGGGMFGELADIVVTPANNAAATFPNVERLPPTGFKAVTYDGSTPVLNSVFYGLTGLSNPDQLRYPAVAQNANGALADLDIDSAGMATLTNVLEPGPYTAIGYIRHHVDAVDSDPMEIVIDDVAPAGYAIAFDQAVINAANQAAISISYTGAEVGSTYSLTLETEIGGTPVVLAGTITQADGQIAGIDCSGLGEGDVDGAFLLTDTVGNPGAVATSTALKDTVAPVVTPPGPITISFAYGGAGLAQDDGALLAWLATASATEGASVTSNIAALGNPITAGTHTVTFSATDAAGNPGQAQRAITVAEGADNIAPTLTGPFTADNITGDGFRLRFTPNEAVSGRIAIYSAEATAPSVGQVLSGSGSPSWDSGLFTNAADVERLIDVNGLQAGLFSAYLALIDNAGNPLLAPLVDIELTGEIDPPELVGDPSIEAGINSLVITFVASKDGQWRMLALPAGADEPSPLEVFAGTGAGGAAPARDTGLQPLFDSTNTPAVLAALQADTSYALALGLRDGSGNAQVVMLAAATIAPAVVPLVTLQITRLDSERARLTATANVPVASLQFQLNGQQRIGPAFVAPPFLYDWNLSALESNVYQVTALASLGGEVTNRSAPASVFVAQPELSLDEVFFDEEYGIPQATPEQAFTELVAGFGIPTTEAEMRTEWEKEVTRAGVAINNDSDYSPFWRLVSALVTRPALWLVHLLINGLLPNYFVKYARGAFLDILAEGVNLLRKLSSATVGTIQFSRADASQSLTIPAGTLIMTVPINEKIYRVRTTAEVTMGEGVATLDAPVEATETGSEHNLAAGYYAILEVPIPGVIATNLSGWIVKPGADRESDDELRLRIANQFGTVSGHHIDSVYKSIIAENQGISVNRIYIEHDAPRGPGTANAYILFDVGDNPTPYIDAINQHIIDSAEHGLGDDFLVLPMPETEHDLTVTGYAQASMSPTQKAEMAAGVEQFVRAAFRENDAYNNVSKVLPQGRFSFSRLAEELHRQFPGLVSVAFDLPDIVSDIEVPRLGLLEVNIA